MYPWRSILVINPTSKRSIYLQLTDAFIQEISSGRLHSGQKLPGTRTLSELLGINRKTVINAYDELISQGWLINKKSSGTFIANDLPVVRFQSLTPSSDQISIRSTTIEKFNYIPKYEENKVRITFDGGSPDSRLSPTDWIYKECRSISKGIFKKEILNYSSPLGEKTLRANLAIYLSETRGLAVTSDNILITRGSQMGIFITIHSVIKSGEVVVMGESSYDAAEWAVTNAGGVIERISVNNDGLDTESLEILCHEKQVRLVYITPHHHFPTTVTMSNSKRIHLLNLAEKYGFDILEDDYDYDFHYSSSPILPLASLNPNGRVFYIGSFSKIFAPTLRVGYLIGSNSFIDQASRFRRIIDRQGDHVLQRAIAESISSGELTRHLKKSLLIYRQRRDLMCSLLKEHLNDHIEFDVPEGGMAVWVKFKSIQLLQIQHTLLKEGLSLDIDADLALRYNALRIGFASVNEKEIKTGIEILTKCVKIHAS